MHPSVHQRQMGRLPGKDPKVHLRGLHRNTHSREGGAQWALMGPLGWSTSQGRVAGESGRWEVSSTAVRPGNNQQSLRDRRWRRPRQLTWALHVPLLVQSHGYHCAWGRLCPQTAATPATLAPYSGVHHRNCLSKWTGYGDGSYSNAGPVGFHWEVWVLS